jgi:hypothetical protein
MRQGYHSWCPVPAATSSLAIFTHRLETPKIHSPEKERFNYWRRRLVDSVVALRAWGVEVVIINEMIGIDRGSRFHEDESDY